MIKSFTPNDLVSYLYQELNDDESDQIRQALHSNDDLMDEFLEMKNAFEGLDHAFIQPSDKVVIAIKKKSKPTGLEKYNDIQTAR
ncbi:hypothetical protein [Anditalea andensis]|uniref:Anti-sigma factor n=1 Tax=Anditalea andensis TaxID=1048983 RepID=A0A074L1C4_9BACT|nr:hypothetical protein [Anditalea andensis]KEO73618.1 hypothetical protein EL17_12015 [Anditalea andensis]